MSSEELFQGYSEYLVDDQLIDRFYNDEEIIIPPDEVDETWYPNQYLLLISNANPKKSCLARFEGAQMPLKKIIHDKILDWKIRSRNKEQAFAIDMLLNPKTRNYSIDRKLIEFRNHFP